ncbi:hypothetical protein D6825_01655 [Candidatus Woesearchaeota archaeon]|nr:MAG: hypothetical protein D6825_01655 [Candidatus Woesearchaeota archaeon]
METKLYTLSELRRMGVKPAANLDDMPDSVRTLGYNREGKVVFDYASAERPCNKCSDDLERLLVLGPKSLAEDLQSKLPDVIIDSTLDKKEAGDAVRAREYDLIVALSTKSEDAMTWAHFASLKGQSVIVLEKEYSSRARMLGLHCVRSEDELYGAIKRYL